MKLSFLVVPFFLFVFSPASARADFVCPHVNGSYFVDIKANSVVLTIVNASGVEDAQGELPCDGPMESAFVCQGKVRELDGRKMTFTGPAHPASVVLPKYALSFPEASIKIDDELFRCATRK